MNDDDIREEFNRNIRNLVRKKYKVEMTDERIQELCDELWQIIEDPLRVEH